MKQLMVYLALASTLIGLGYNWRRVDEVAAQSQGIQDAYVRKDVIGAQFTDIQRQLDEIKQMVARQARGTGVYESSSDSGSNGRRFDR